jgi:hypothetical protein
MTLERMTELSILVSLIGFNEPGYDIEGITKRANELLLEFLAPYKVNTQVDDTTTKVD